MFGTREIRDQVYDEKASTVTIMVVGCDPEKIRDKLCCKGHKVIKSIEIKEPSKPGKPNGPENPKVTETLTVVVEVQKPKPSGPPPAAPKPPTVPEPVTFIGLPPLYPVPTCCGQCYGGFDGGPCHQGYGVPPQPRPCFDGFYGYRCGRGCGYGYGRDCRHFSRCDYYLSAENPSSCPIM